MSDPDPSSPADPPLPLTSPRTPLQLSFPFLREGSRIWERERKPPQPGELPSPLPTKRTRTYSAIEGEYVPMEGDEVTYKVCPIPPKNQKIQAVDVMITHLNPGTKHETWSGQIISS
ncbi:cold shock domain-containing protein C2a [Xyrichtys novacula]|uniref:Cold shock domain-containing protein C2a n=1 Tax=Xyrichtys novacula TaxID=13765 RepID=A0AAV1H3R6_XYRNO|nr:cold shock domain-containing protein C2a [Xyrichtys novacula]